MAFFDVIIVGAGAAGLMAAITAGERGRRVLLVEHGRKIGPKILISGGGRCNFTNMDVVPAAYLSSNLHFAKSALARYTQWDFIELMAKADLTWNEKKLGQLFCDQGSKAVVAMLEKECRAAGVRIALETEVSGITQSDAGFSMLAGGDAVSCSSLVIATGGLSIPKMGATGFAYQIARQFDLAVTETRPALVPFTFQNEELAFMKALAGVSIDAVVSCGKASFRENLLFTHRGLSGPAILQISSYWREGEAVTIDLLPGRRVRDIVEEARENNPKQKLSRLLGEYLPNRYVEALLSGAAGMTATQDVPLAQVGKKLLARLEDHLHGLALRPQGTEGYRTAEVTLGGIDTDCLSSKTMETKSVPGLYFIGECVDVTGWLGGYNFQWAWASGHAAGEVI